ncbi:MAG: 23S rRNA (adenine(2503)-C(2))-methyltransferase RlmN [Desulfobacteraceae bacterium]|nr:23S rRNA (adenine(2503)-C(2))-methyltransferase RlmN [Desulfobacteraceae bacterium]
MTSSPPQQDIKNFDRDQLVRYLDDQGIRSFRAAQILKWIYIRQVDTFDEMTDLKRDTRSSLDAAFTIERLKNKAVETSSDGTRKYLFELSDGNHIESVLIPEKNHYTLCISSQVGCALGCRFCRTARIGRVRDLTRGEIVAQVRDITRDLGEGMRLTNIVFMGMGEPLANYDNVVSAIHTFVDNESGMRLSARKITVSTAGLVPEIVKLGNDTTVNLAVSLNAADNRIRDKLMPINRKYPLEQLIDACRRYPLPKGRRITFEYILIKDINDSLADAGKLVKLLRPVKAKVNLIPFNAHDKTAFARPSEGRIDAFFQYLLDHNYTAIIRRSKGQDISAACGQLAAGAGSVYEAEGKRVG